MPKVSVIIAVYNVEPYLEKCLDSLLSQTLSDIEIIAVNDGSTDRSQDILNRYAAQFPQLKCHQKENGGAATARNLGLRFATGEYIGYVDSDDFVDPDMFEVMYNKAVETDSDIVECNLRHTRPNGEDTDVEVMERYTEKGQLLCFGRYVVWNKIYRRSWLLAAGAHFPENLIYEDVQFVANLVPYIGAYAYVDIAPVHYVQRASSVNNSTSAKTMHIFQILKNITAFYREKGFYAQYVRELEYLYMRILLCSSLSRICHMPGTALRKQALRENWQLLVQTWPHWRANTILKAQKSRQALFMKSVNAATYRLYGLLLPLLYRARGKGGGG